LERTVTHNFGMHQAGRGGADPPSRAGLGLDRGGWTGHKAVMVSQCIFRGFRGSWLFLWLAVVGMAWAAEGPQSLFDGKTFEGWNGDTKNTWRIVDGVILGGSLEKALPHNEFLATDRAYTNFVLRLRFKLLGTEGFVNSGVQIRSQRIPNHHEMIGYQADIGEGWWGCLYDESRRNTVLARPAPGLAERTVRVGEWNSYEIRAEGRRIRLKINDVELLDYTEPDLSLPQWGVIGLQIHDGGKAEIHFKDITLEELP
jgi:hypothetical protein